MEKLKTFIKTHQVKIVLVFGYLLVAVLAFGLGRFTAYKYSAPEVRVEESFQAPSNYTPSVSGVQTDDSSASSATPAPSAGDCAGKIKGASSMIYHVPGDSFYKRTTHPIRCFDTEAEAKAAGFRKSAR